MGISTSTLKFLGVDEYNTAEIKGMKSLPVRSIACCKPKAFIEYSFPTRVHALNELPRYVDSMHGGRFQYYYKTFMGLTADELVLFKTINKILIKLSRKMYGASVVSKSSLLRSIHDLRHIKAMFPEGGTILEIGPGDGFLSALLVMNGYSYIGTDITQPFYILQNHLLNIVTGGKLIELATIDMSFSDINKIEPGQAVHIPWWKYVVANPKCNTQVDCVIANEVLEEMHQDSLVYNLLFWKQMLSGSNNNVALYAHGYGAPLVPVWVINKRLTDYGYVCAYYDSFFVWTLSANRCSKNCLILPYDVRIPQGDFDVETFNSSYLDKSYSIPELRTPDNILAQRIIESKNNILKEHKAPYGDVLNFIRVQVGEDSALSADEHFAEFLRNV